MTTNKTLELPDWLDAHAAVAAGNATPLQHFVSEYQPAAPELAEPFRVALAAALAQERATQHAAGEVQRRIIGYTTQFDLDFPFAYPNLGSEGSDRTIPVYVDATLDLAAQGGRDGALAAQGKPAGGQS